MSESIVNVTCPTCSKTVQWSIRSPFRPFCSKHCQLVDFGEWMKEERCISSDVQITDDDRV
ncbi:DNA gyrase inhibitor YacG [Candidatus Doolittlea endobia]|uniref:DNA gyrase inhibitor YacG n=1 Tax=Candidatus Doolittlea endobia TaxID=1778262 RepID=A0A143WSZ4_9ENTR|nr:DNA gyrase inhibitor YacG [Candidatus Doolittlea endobia]CUX96914.1 DNA gyrase inhibitor YacG [Candidatus Doolittlea endobia]